VNTDIDAMIEIIEERCTEIDLDFEIVKFKYRDDAEAFISVMEKEDVRFEYRIGQVCDGFVIYASRVFFSRREVYSKCLSDVGPDDFEAFLKDGSIGDLTSEGALKIERMCEERGLECEISADTVARGDFDAKRLGDISQSYSSVRKQVTLTKLSI
jgi:hypothetical protein